MCVWQMCATVGQYGCVCVCVGQCMCVYVLLCVAVCESMCGSVCDSVCWQRLAGGVKPLLTAACP